MINQHFIIAFIWCLGAAPVAQAQLSTDPIGATLDVNKVYAQINSNGVLFTDFARGQFVPVHPELAELTLVRSAGLWVMGRDQTGILRGSVQVSGGSQQTDYRPGLNISTNLTH